MVVPERHGMGLSRKLSVMNTNKKSLCLVTLLSMLAVGLLTASCSDEVKDGGFTTRGSDIVADTIIVGSKGEIPLRRVEQVEDMNLVHIPTTLGGETWRWVGIGDGESYKPVFPWHGAAMYYIGFLPNGSIDMHCGANTVYGSYVADDKSLSISINGHTRIGTLSVAEQLCDDLFLEAVEQAISYEITTRGFLRIYYSDTEYLQFVSAKAAGGNGVGFSTLEGCFGTWRLVGVYYANGAFVCDGGGEVRLKNDYTVVTSGGGSLLTPKLSDGLHYYDLEHSSLSVGGCLYNAVNDGNRLYLCGGLDLESPTLVLERDEDSPTGITAGSFVQRDGFHAEMYLTDSTGQRKDRFAYGENVVFNIDITNECDTSISLPVPAALFESSSHTQFWLEGTGLAHPTMLANVRQSTPNDPTIVAAYATRHWQCTLFQSKTIETTPPLGISKFTTPFVEGSYFIVTYLNLGSRFSVKVRKDFVISEISDGIPSISFR